MPLTLLYRGTSSWCNYDCGYCPFRSSHAPQPTPDTDQAELARLLAWLADRQGEDLRLFFTPRGEALALPSYREAIQAACRLPQVRRVAVQTNLSFPLAWLEDEALRSKLGLWCSYHPSQVAQAEFVRRCNRLRQLGIPCSAGIVGVRENLPAAIALRAALPEDMYLWINAYKHGEDYYRPAEIASFAEIDPLFHFSLSPRPARGVACRCGNTVLAVHGDGTVQRCWFCPAPLGNLFAGSWQPDLSPCPNPECRCHIGYVHAPDLEVGACFGEGILERVPLPGWPRSPGAVGKNGAFRQMRT